MPRYRGNPRNGGVRSTLPPQQIATPPTTPAPDYGGWDPAGDEWSAPMAMEENGWGISEPPPEMWKELFFTMQKKKGELDEEVEELKERLKTAPSGEEFIRVHDQLREIEEENKQLRTEVTKAKEEVAKIRKEVQSIAEERNNLREELEVKLRLQQAERNDVDQRNKDLASVNQGLKKRVKELERELTGERDEGVKMLMELTDTRKANDEYKKTTGQLTKAAEKATK